MPIPHENDHLNRSLNKVPLQYQKAGWEALFVRSWIPQIQRIENTANELLDEYRLETATYAYLDAWGDFFQLPRTEQDDPDDTWYRAALWARAAQLRSFGSLAETADIAGELSPTGGSAFLLEAPPRGAIIQFNGELTPNQRGMAAMVAYSAAPVGVRFLVSLEEMYDSDPEGFVLAPPDLESVMDARAAGTLTLEPQEHFLDQLDAGEFRMDSFGF